MRISDWSSDVCSSDLRAQFDDDVRQLCISRDVGIVTYFSLASGFLTGKYRRPEDVRGARSARVQKYMTPAGLNVLSTLDAVSAETGMSLAQISLAWVAAQPGITAPVASATSHEQLENLVGAVHAKTGRDEG